MKSLLAFSFVCVFAAIAIATVSEEKIDKSVHKPEQIAEQTESDEEHKKDAIFEGVKNIISIEEKVDPDGGDQSVSVSTFSEVSEKEEPSKSNQSSLSSVDLEGDFQNHLSDSHDASNRALYPDLFCVCGVGSISSSQVAGVQDYPWTVQIIRKLDGSLLCAGSIISSVHILTTASCVLNYVSYPGKIVVRVGTQTRRDIDGTQLLVGAVKVHEDYKNVQESNIAILTLRNRIQFSNNVRPVCIPPAKQIFIDQTGFVSNWVSVAPLGSLDNILVEKRIIMKEAGQCIKDPSKLFANPGANPGENPGATPGANSAAMATPSQSSDYIKEITKLLCAFQTGRNGCQGYNGGVLVQLDAFKISYQIGIAAFAVDCKPTSYSMIYTNIVYYREWILKTITAGYACYPQQTIPTNAA